MSLKCDCSNEKFKIITYFIEHKNDKQLLEQYAIGKMVGATHQEIIKKDNDTNDTDGLCKKKNEFISGVLSPDAYYSHYDACCKFLLYLNIVEENKLNKLQKEKKLQNRKFDFSIWAYRSLEHIFPKSRVYHKDENGTFYRGDNMQCSDAEIAEIQKGNQTWLSREELENLTENKLQNIPSATLYCSTEIIILNLATNLSKKKRKHSSTLRMLVSKAGIFFTPSLNSLFQNGILKR